MCGLVGYIQLGGIEQGSASSILERMNNAIAHRGPDDEGYYVNPQCAMAHRRLSVIDVECGHQPWLSADKQICLVFNGEIYNHRELRVQLEGKGYQYTSQCDTETLLYAYQEWGEKCVDRLRGMFAFVVWDQSKQLVFCARDRLGLKPLYYFANNEIFIFASELKSLLQHPEIPRTIDRAGLVNYLRLGYYPAPQTPIENIHKLTPATTLNFNSNGLSLNTYWQLPEAQTNDDYSCARQELDRLLEDAVACRLESDVPIGTFLSGGVDSSTVLAYVSKLLKEKPQTHCLRFDLAGINESKYAQAVADLFGSEHEETQVDDALIETIPKILWHMDEPFADDSAIPTYYLCQAAKKRMSVALSGDGADEIFAGYPWYRQLLLHERLSCITPRWLESLFGQLFPKGRLSNFRGASFLENIGLAVDERHANLRSIFSDRQISDLLDAPVSMTVKHPILAEYKKLKASRDVVMDAQSIDMQLYLAEDILMKVDKMSMAHGLEVRAPFLDHKLVEFGMGLPSDHKCDRYETKKILKDLINDLLPESIVRRKKQGFSSPLGEWLLGELNPLVDQYLLTPENGSGLFDSKEVRKLWKRFRRQSIAPELYVDTSRHIWALLSFEIWYDLYINGKEH